MLNKKPRCMACYSCPAGVIGCEIDTGKCHSHGGTVSCPICGIPFYQTHPHSNICPHGSPIRDNVEHNMRNLRRQLEFSMMFL